jgi:hypothetical protein
VPERASHDRQEVRLRRNPREQISLDEVAKGLASGSISRRKVLRLVESMLGSNLLASVPGVALAQIPAQAQEFCPNPAEACCTCRYRERGTTETFRSKCYLLPTSRCGRRRGHELFERCQELCEENRPRRLRTQSVSMTCRQGENSNAVCEQVPTGTKCLFLECTQPAEVTVENMARTSRTP